MQVRPPSRRPLLAVTTLSRSLPDAPTPNVTYLQGDATDEATLSAPIEGADVVVGALAPCGPLAGTFRDAYSTIARLAGAAGVSLFVVGGYSSLRPAPGADRFVTDLSHIPAELHDEIRAGVALIIEDLPAAPATVDWVFVSPALRFGAHIRPANNSAIIGSATTLRFSPRTAARSPHLTTPSGSST